MQNEKLLGTGPGQVALRVVAALLLIAAALLIVLHLPAEAQANDRDVSGVTLTSPNPGELVIAWDAPGNAPDDYRVTWKKSTASWPSHRSENTVAGGNAFPSGTSHTVTGLEEGTAYKARVRARYHNSGGRVEKSGPWSATEEIAVAQTPLPAKPTGLVTAASHDNVLLSWDNPDDDTITGYQVLRGPDADNLATLADDTGDANTSYTDSNVAAQTSYAYAVKARNARGLGPQSDPVTATTLAAPQEPRVARAVSVDATLSALTLKDARDNAVALDPTFASGTTSYNAKVANSVSRIKVEPTANDSNAAIDYLDDNDATLTDEDTSTADVFDFDLSVGANVVKVKVTAEDSTTTKNYIITVNRVDFLVSNLGQYSDTSRCVAAMSPGLATQFTTGSEADGYLISEVWLEFFVSSGTGTIPRVSIYSDSTGQPGSSLKVLTNPATIPTTSTELGFGADDYKLDPSTPYWIVVEWVSGRGLMCVSYTRTYTAEDTGTAVGWSIGDNGSILSGGTWSASGTWSTVTPGTKIPLIAVRGTVAPPVTDDATLSALALFDSNSDGVTLSPAFAAAVTSYTAAVANAHADGELEATPNDSNATVEFLDENDATIATVTQTGNVHSILPDFDIGENVVKVKVTAEDGTTTRTYTVTVTRQPKPNNPPTGSPTIAVQLEVGHTLIASTSGIGDPDGLNAPGFTYQWQRQDGGVFTDISGATGMLYTLTSDDEGKRVRVEVTFTDDDGNRHTLTGAPTGEVQA